MSYLHEAYEEAYRLRQHGTDDDSIRMILVSKKLDTRQIDALFEKLDEELPPGSVAPLKLVTRADRLSKRLSLIFLLLLFMAGIFIWFQVRGSGFEEICIGGLLLGGLGVVINMLRMAADYKRQERIEQANQKWYRGD